MSEQNVDPKSVFSRRKYKFLPIVSIFIILFAVIGFIWVVSFFSKLTVSLINRKNEFDYFKSKIYTVMMFDPITFDSPAKLDDVTLIQMCMWSVLLGENRDSYVYDESMQLSIPSSDLDVAAKKLFGSAVTLSHQTFYDNDVLYQYNYSSQTYSVPVAWQPLLYTPQLESVEKRDDIVYLTVSYISPSTLWNTDSTGKIISKNVDKTLVYVLQKIENDYVIVALQENIANTVGNSGVS